MALRVGGVAIKVMAKPRDLVAASDYTKIAVFTKITIPQKEWERVFPVKLKEQKCA